jgi:hypothetical protein
MDWLVNINDEYTKKLNKLITRKWCIGRRFRWYGASTFKTRMDECVKRNISVIPSKIIRKIIKNIKVKNETTLNYQKALEKTKNLFGEYRDKSYSKSSWRKSSKSWNKTSQNNLQELHNIDFFLNNFLHEDVFSDIVSFEKTVKIVLLYNFLNIMTTSNDYYEKKGLNIFRTHFGGSRKTRKIQN